MPRALRGPRTGVIMTRSTAGLGRAGALIALGALACSLLIVQAGVARAQQVYDVSIGMPLNDETVPGESMRFFPDRLTVHQGDVLRFTTQSFHNAALLPANVGAQDWLDENAQAPTGPWGVVVLDPDEGELKFNNRIAFPTRFDCGTPENPCVHDGDPASNDGGVLNSGVPIAGPVDFSVRVEAQPGDFFWVVCLVHTQMRMKVTVVPEEEAASDPTVIAGQNASRIAQDTTQAQALHSKLSRRQSSHREDGRRVWDAWVGFDTRYISLLAMYPRKLNIRRGDTVQYHFDQLNFEIHSATMPSGRGRAFARENFFAMVCDPDGDAGTQPDQPPGEQGCADPTQTEFDVSLAALAPSGNGRYTGGDDFEHSGILGPGLPDGPWEVRFTRVTNRRGVGYICVVHPFMIGRVRVRR